MSAPAWPRVLIADETTLPSGTARGQYSSGRHRAVRGGPDAPGAVTAALREHPDTCLLDA